MRQLTHNNDALREEIRRELDSEFKLEMAQELAKKEKLLSLNNKKKLERQLKELKKANEIEF